MKPRCGRCQAGSARPVIHSRHTHLCDFCMTYLHASPAENIRAGVDFWLASDPRGPVVAKIAGILSEAQHVH